MVPLGDMGDLSLVVAKGDSPGGAVGNNIKIRKTYITMMLHLRTRLEEIRRESVLLSRLTI